MWEEALAAPPHDGPPVWVQATSRETAWCATAGCAASSTGARRAPATPLSTSRSSGRRCSPTSRVGLLDALDVDDATVARSRGAAINQACAALPYYLHTYPLIVERSWHKLAALGVPAAAPS